MSASIEVRHAVEADRPALAAMLARAFRDEGFVSWFVRHDQRRDQAFLRYFEINLQLSMPHGYVYTTTDFHSAALWVPPDKWQLGTWEQLKLLPAIIAITGLKQLLSRNLAVFNAEKLHPTEPHYYLLAVGTEPEFQGQGLGSAVIQPGLTLCDQEHMPAYLETPTQSLAETFYPRFGFEIMSTFKMPYNGPTIWRMWRKPQ